MKKRRSRAIPPVLVRCDQSRLDALRESVTRSIEILSTSPTRLDYNMADNKIASIEVNAGPFVSLHLTYSQTNLHCQDGQEMWTFHTHLPLSQMPHPHSAEDVITALKIAQRVVDRAYNQNLKRLSKTVETNDIIADVLAHAAFNWHDHDCGSDNPEAKTFLSFNNPSRTYQVRPWTGSETEFHAAIKPWMDRTMPCLFIDHKIVASVSRTAFGRGAIIRDKSISPLSVMRSLTRAAELFPDLQPPMRANAT